LVPPGEVRLALEGTKRRLRYLFLRQFGVQQVVPELVILNKSSGEDRTEEVIFDGRRVARLSYDLQTQDYSLMLRIDGARMLAALNSKKTIVLTKASGHMKGQYLPRDAIKSFDAGIRAGDEVVIQMGQFIGCGVAKVDAPRLKTSPKGVKVRDFEKGGEWRRRKKSWTRAMIRANEQYLAAIKARAEHEIRGAIDSHDLPVTVSFSGGKDSLVALDLLKSVTSDFSTIFVDTGLEHPWTREYVNKFASENGLGLLTASAGDAFERNFHAFGPPAKDFRWCCKVCKLAPASELIEDRFPNGVLTIEGNRRLESFSRSRIEVKEENPFVPGQLVVNPIRDWTALEVWLYIIWRKLRYNPLYDEDLERVGCWMCPSALASEYKEIARAHAGLVRAWQADLEEWARQNSLPADFIKYGFWRWKQLPPKMKELSDRLGLEVERTRSDKLRLDVTKGASPCTAGGFSVEGVLRMPTADGLAEVAEMLKTIGDVKPVEEFGVAIVDSRLGRGKAFAGGQMSAVAETQSKSLELFDSVSRAVLRANMCTRCGICERTCPQSAISIDESVKVDGDKCIRCGKCTDSCVVAHYFDKLAEPLRADAKPRQKRRAA